MAEEPVEEKATEEQEPDAVVRVVKCASCGGSHKTVGFAELAKVGDGSTHWGVYPETGDPIFLAVTTRRRSAGAHAGTANGGSGRPRIRGPLHSRPDELRRGLQVGSQAALVPRSLRDRSSPLNAATERSTTMKTTALRARAVETAPEAYDRRRAEIDGLLTRLNGLLAEHADRQAGKPTTTPGPETSATSPSCSTKP